MSFGDETLNPMYETEDRLRDDLRMAVQLLELCQPFLPQGLFRDTIRRVAAGELTVAQAWIALQAATGGRTEWPERG